MENNTADAVETRNETWRAARRAEKRERAVSQARRSLSDVVEQLREAGVVAADGSDAGQALAAAETALRWLR